MIYIQKSVETLHKMFRHNQELQSSVTDTMLRFYSTMSNDVDIIALERIRYRMHVSYRGQKAFIMLKACLNGPHGGDYRSARFAEQCGSTGI